MPRSTQVALFTSALALAAATAHAEAPVYALVLDGRAPPTGSAAEARRGSTDVSPERVQGMRQVVPTAAAASGLAQTRTIYLNRGGGLFTPGHNHSGSNTSTIVTRATQVPGWTVSDADWAATVACMRQMWARFDVAITDVDPGATPHIEAVFTRAPSDVGISDEIGGVSPFSTSCAVIEHSVVFAFTDKLPKRPRAVCEVMSQEIAHSYGLDHQLVAADPMTYLPYAGERSFQDVDAQCGEYSARPCGIAGNTCRASQNSVQLLRARLGAAGRDNTAPSVGITAPADRATVDAGFAIAVTASDNVAIARVEFYVDGELVATRTQPPYELAAPALAPGPHTIVVEAIDADGNVATSQRDVTVAGDDGGGPFEVVGCSTGREPPGALIAIALGWLALRRRRR